MGFDGAKSKIKGIFIMNDKYHPLDPRHYMTDEEIELETTRCKENLNDPLCCHAIAQECISFLMLCGLATQEQEEFYKGMMGEEWNLGKAGFI